MKMVFNVMEYLLTAKLGSKYTFTGSKRGGKPTLSFEDRLLAKMVKGSSNGLYIPLSY